MRFDPDIADMRFGFGRAPHIASPTSVDAVLAGVSGPDTMVDAFPIDTFGKFGDRMAQMRAAIKARRESTDQTKRLAAQKRRDKVVKSVRNTAFKWMGQGLLRAAHTETAFRERLIWFWADHFTAQGKRGVIRWATAAFIDQTIRPNVSARFSDLMAAAVLHPLMLHYLDQATALGPNSRRGIQTGGARGLNENLAREVLELHTVGAGGPYTQDDVRELAELFTGLSVDRHAKTTFRKSWAEPGPETVLGRRYSGKASLATIRDALDDLARHPATAKHIARKLAVHFLGDTPDAAAIDHIAARFLQTDGDLPSVYAALLEHPAAWDPELRNAKPPADFVASTMRALAVSPERMAAATTKQLRRGLFVPMERMGQPWLRPPGPDGWPEEDTDWFTPQGLAWRIKWAMAAPEALTSDLPDPRDFVETALGRFANERVRFAAASAEQRAEAIGLVLMSPSFQRR